jgi:hypothetical protein
MLASAVFVIALSIESLVNADMDMDMDTPSAEGSAVDITSIYQIRHSLLDKDFPVSLCFQDKVL